jgi:hypothetical protein
MLRKYRGLPKIAYDVGFSIQVEYSGETLRSGSV